MKRLRRCGVFLLSLLAVAVFALGLGYRWNWTDSAPLGLWRISSTPVAVGDSVLVCPPPLVWIRDLVRRNYAAPGYCRSGTVPFIKTVAALDGATYEITTSGVVLDDQLINRSRPMSERFISTPRAGTVQAGDVFLVSTRHLHSIDSRYFGPVNLQDSSARVIEPVWTW